MGVQRAVKSRAVYVQSCGSMPATRLCLSRVRLAAGKTIWGHLEAVDHSQIRASMHAIWPHCPAHSDCAYNQYLFAKLYSLQSPMYARLAIVLKHDCVIASTFLYY